ncbi:unnamed protein product [Meganyctiphanes norvegica]|uniref:Uncharacterized protein n=1 Tax=Meganyctiphanes norvegica TaxID=48144 RepID=A0AAV2Q9S9_MEGNR
MDNYNNGTMQLGIDNSLAAPPPMYSSTLPRAAHHHMLTPQAPPIDAFEETDMIVINPELPKMAASIARFKTLVLLKVLVLLLTVICLLLVCFIYTIYLDKETLLHQLEDFSDHHASILEQVQELHRDQVEKRLEDSMFQNDVLKKRLQLSERQLKDCNGGSASINVNGFNIYLIGAVLIANKLTA